MKRTTCSFAVLALLGLSLLLPPAPAQAGPGYALSFSAHNNYVSAEIPELTKNYTLSAWVYLRQGGNYDTSRAGVLTGTSGGNSVEFLIRSATSDAADPQYLELGRSGAFDGYSSTNTVPLNQWAHVAITVSSSKYVSYFVNGNAAGSFRYSADYNMAVGPAIYLGSQNPGRYFDGLLDEVQIWSRALTPAEIQAGMNQVPNVADTNLVAYWPFEEGPGADTTADASGHGHTGTLVNAPDWEPSGVLLDPEGSSRAPEEALAFDGVDDYVETGTAVIPSSGDFTVACWAYCPVAPNAYREVLSQGGSGNAFYIGTDPANNIRVGDGWGTMSSPVAFPIGGWHHLAVVKSSTNTLLYLDGTNRIARGSAIPNPAASGLRFGRQYGYGGPENWSGSLGDVRIWRRALSADEISMSRLTQPAGAETNLVAWWQFNEGGGPLCKGLKGSLTGLQTNVLGTLLNGTTRVVTHGAVLNGPEEGSECVALYGAWTAATTNDWLHLPATNGSAAQNGVFSYDANPGATRRGLLTLGGRTITVTQAGAGYVQGNEINTLVSTGLAGPGSVAVDPEGNFYIGDAGNSTIKKWNAASNTLTVIASGDYVAVDGAGTVYFADSWNGALKKWNPDSNTVTTLVSGLQTPRGLAVDTAGNVYIAEYMGNMIRKWNAANNSLSTLIGSSILQYPEGVAVDAAGNLFFPGYNDTIREWNQADNSTSIKFGMAPLDTASGVAVDPSGRIYASARNNNEIFYCGQGTSWEAGEIGGLNRPSGVTVDGAGNVYIPDTDNLAIKVWRRTFVDRTTKLVGGAAGNAVLASVLPANTALDGSSAPTCHQPWLTITGATNGVVSFSFTTNSGPYSRMGTITMLGHDITVLQASVMAPALATLGTAQLVEGPDAGTASVVLGTVSSSLPWTATANVSWLHLTTPNGMGSTNVLFTYDANSGITRTGTLTIAGQPLTVTQAGAAYVCAPNSPTVLSSSGLTNPASVAVDPAGNVYVTELETGMLKRWNVASNTVTTVATVNSSAGSWPLALAVDDLGNVFVTDSKAGVVKKWDAANSTLATWIDNFWIGVMGGIGLDAAGNIYVSSLYDGAIEKWNVTNDTITTLIPSGFNYPKGVAVDAAGNLYIADSANNAIKKWNAANQTVSTLVSGLDYPVGVAVDGSGNVYIAVQNSMGILRWNANDNTLTTLANNELSFSAGNVAVDKAGNVFFSEFYSQAIHELPRAFVDPTARFAGPAAGNDTLPAVLPATVNLRDPFAPTSDQPWLTITGVTNGVVSYAYTAYSGSASRTANITLLTRIIPITQSAVPNIGSWRFTGANQFRFQFTGAPAATYTVLSATNLALPLNNWLPTGQILETSPGQFQFTDTNAPAGSQRFYRLRTP